MHLMTPGSVQRIFLFAVCSDYPAVKIRLFIQAMTGGRTADSCTGMVKLRYHGSWNLYMIKTEVKVNLPL